MTVPFLHTLAPSNTSSYLFKADNVPWIGTYIIVTKHSSPFKGYVGVVKNVLHGQNTASSLKIAIQLMHLNPTSSFQMAIIDYNDVVEQKFVIFCSMGLST